MKCELILVNYKRKDGSEGVSMELVTPNGTRMRICDFFGNKKLEYKIRCEVAEVK